VKRIILAVIGAAAAAGLTACNATSTPAAAPATHSSARVPVSCRQQYNTWTHGQGKGLIAALQAVSSAATAGDAHVLTATLNRTRPAVSRGTHHPVPACADPRGYWDVLLMHVHAAAATKATAASRRAAIKDVPNIERHLAAELKDTTH